MGLFRRTPSPEQVRARQDEAITAFWTWWLDAGRAAATAAFDEGPEAGHDLVALTNAIGDRVTAISPDLAMETGAGRTARHVLVVTPAGNPDVRDVAGRWLAAAPPVDDAFEYADSRQPVADPGALSIQLGGPGGTGVDLASATVVAVPDGREVHVQLSHPAFAGLPDQARGQITFLFLDALLGEAAVEEHVGHVEWTSRHDRPAVPLLDLRELVEAARRA